MKIILSPTKSMQAHDDGFAVRDVPALLTHTEEIKAQLQSMTGEELQKLWGCNDKIAAQNMERLQHMHLERNLTAAIDAYEGIAFQYMSPNTFDTDQLEYVQQHLRILSAFYGVLKPLDGVTPYRLEMQAKLAVGKAKNLYTYWGSLLYDAVRDDDSIIINLASKEYSKCIEKYLQPSDTYITITFCEQAKGKLVTRATHAKMARGEMVRFMAEHKVTTPVELQQFKRFGYVYRSELSSPNEYVFVK